MTNLTVTHPRQRGAVMLTAVVLLLVLVTLVTLYTGKSKSLEHKIALNNINYGQAFSAAEAGLMHALGVLTEQPSWDGAVINEVLADQTSFAVSAVEQAVERETNSFDLFTFTSVGLSADALGSVTLSEQAMSYSIIANPPDVPLIVEGGLVVGGNFEVVANANGGGNGVPISIWTDTNVDLTNGSGTTCGQQEFFDGNCSSSPYSERGFKDLDIVDNDPGFPTDLLEYLFNVPEDEWPLLRADANQILASCAPLNANSTGLIWVDGPCTLNAGTVVGSADEPAIVIVTDNDITMNGGAEVFGILFSFRKPNVIQDFEIDMNGGAKVNGVVASNHSVGHANGTFNVVYDAEVLSQIEQNDAFKRVARIPGSWRDF